MPGLVVLWVWALTFAVIALGPCTVATISLVRQACRDTERSRKV
jgi:hypothetical protein